MLPNFVYPVFGIVGVATGIIGFRYAGTRSSRVLAMPETPVLASWLGGLRTRACLRSGVAGVLVTGW